MTGKESIYKGGFRELEVWKEARVFRNEISGLTKTLPDIEKYRLTDQLYRASRSITACIAEGYGAIPLSGEYTVLPTSKRFIDGMSRPSDMCSG